MDDLQIVPQNVARPLTVCLQITTYQSISDRSTVVSVLATSFDAPESLSVYGRIVAIGFLGAGLRRGEKVGYIFEKRKLFDGEV